MNRLASRINPSSLRSVYRKPAICYRTIVTSTNDNDVKSTYSNNTTFDQHNVSSSLITIKSINDTLHSEYQQLEQKLDDLQKHTTFPPNLKQLAEQSLSRFKNYNGLILSEINKIEHSVTNPSNTITINNIQPVKKYTFLDILKFIFLSLFFIFCCYLVPPLIFLIPLLFLAF